MLASMLAILIVAIMSLDNTRKLSPKKINIWTVTIMMIIAAVQAYHKTQTLMYRVSGDELISDWHSAQLFRYKLNHYLYMSGWTAVFTVWRICGRITCYAAVLYHDDDRSLDFAVPRGRGVPEYGQISYIHIAPGALN